MALRVPETRFRLSHSATIRSHRAKKENFVQKILVRTLLHSLGEASPCLATTSSMNAAKNGKRAKIINRATLDPVLVVIIG